MTDTLYPAPIVDPEPGAHPLRLPVPLGYEILRVASPGVAQRILVELSWSG